VSELLGDVKMSCTGGVIRDAATIKIIKASQDCYTSVARVLHECSNSVTRVLQSVGSAEIAGKTDKKAYKHKHTS
jgi:uncharacterized protein YaaQ